MQTLVILSECALNMEVHNKEEISILNQNALREVQIEGGEKSNLEVPELGNDHLNRVTQSSEPYDLSGTLSDGQNSFAQEECAKPGIPPPSVDNTDETGIDCTREPDWEVIKPTQLPEEPEPNKIHNDRYWDERSLDQDIVEKDLQDEMIEESTFISDREIREADEYGRSEANKVLDPYYNSATDFNHHHPENR